MESKFRRIGNMPRCRILSCILAVALCALASCGKDDNVPVGKPQYIGFLTSTDTRAIIDGNDEATDNTIAKDAAAGNSGFGVVGYRKLTTKWEQTFNNQLVMPVTPLADPVAWYYSPIQWWENCAYRFFAYYPHKASPTFDLSKCLEDDASKVVFTVQHTVPNTWSTSYVADQQDFMLSAHKMVAVEQNGETVAFNFRHALSKVAFKVLKEGDTNLEIVDLQVHGINQKGKANSNATNITWGSQSDLTEYSYLSGLGADKSIPREDIPAMLLLPQDVTQTRLVVLTVKDDDGLTWTLTGKLRTESVTSWKAGKSYLYTLTVKTDPTLLDLAVTVAEWTDVKIHVTM